MCVEFRGVARAVPVDWASLAVILLASADGSLGVCRRSIPVRAGSARLRRQRERATCQSRSPRHQSFPTSAATKQVGRGES